ncbi:acyltransferase [Flammeovirga aprica]|uniref:Chloramphenicol acetyltransferase n=1 Tax=Flammeovirga aprica JL-4 TaxID=694437 RepID=A0A7X9RT84_9BACT|nr:acyltransferase [Flammeovirga aprica]NME68175.1 acyltransferase [Flammeovirga aprica JL-4]
MSYLSKQQLSSIGFKSIGDNVLISDKASFYGVQNITIGNNVRIDDFCILSAGEEDFLIGNYIHIGCYTSLIGKGKIILCDYSNISSKVAIYSSNDDYSGEFMTNPMVPSDLTNVTKGSVVIKKHVIIGSGCVLLPNVTIGEGVAIGALSLVNSNCEEFNIYAGSPVKKIKKRKKDLLELEKKIINNYDY